MKAIQLLFFKLGYVPSIEITRITNKLNKKVKIREDRIKALNSSIKIYETAAHYHKNEINRLDRINKQSDKVWDENNALKNKIIELNKSLSDCRTLYIETEKSRKILVGYNEENKKDAIKYMNLYNKVTNQK